MITYTFWLYFGLTLLLLEFVLPGLISVFIGLGALTVALGLYLGFELNLMAQLLLFFVSSTVYIFSLRLLVMRFYPTDTEKQRIDEDDLSIGSLVIAVDDFDESGRGRISYNGISWSAKTKEKKVVNKGEELYIIGRDNITWYVDKVD